MRTKLGKEVKKYNTMGSVRLVVLWLIFSKLFTIVKIFLKILKSEKWHLLDNI